MNKTETIRLKTKTDKRVRNQISTSTIENTAIKCLIFREIIQMND